MASRQTIHYHRDRARSSSRMRNLPAMARLVYMVMLLDLAESAESSKYRGALHCGFAPMTDEELARECGIKTYVAKAALDELLRRELIEKVQIDGKEFKRVCRFASNQDRFKKTDQTAVTQGSVTAVSRQGQGNVTAISEQCQGSTTVDSKRVRHQKSEKAPQNVSVPLSSLQEDNYNVPYRDPARTDSGSPSNGTSRGSQPSGPITAGQTLEVMTRPGRFQLAPGNGCPSNGEIAALVRRIVQVTGDGDSESNWKKVALRFGETGDGWLECQGIVLEAEEYFAHPDGRGNTVRNRGAFLNERLRAAAKRRDIAI